MFHLIWYLLIGLIAAFGAESILQVHLPMPWMMVLGLVGSLVGGCVAHLFSRAKKDTRFHPAGLLFSTVGAILVLLLWHTLKLHLPAG